MIIMEIEREGRKYKAYSDGGKNQIIIGPPEGLVDDLGIPEPFATNLHNILYERGILTYKDAQNSNNLIGAVQEAIHLDAQKLTQAFFRFSEEVRHD